MHNYEHVLERVMQRAQDKTEKEKKVMIKTFVGLYSRIKTKRNMPNRDWYRPIHMGKDVIGYWVGNGCIIQSYLHQDMAPRGTRV